MKKKFLSFSLAVLGIGLLGACSNSDLDDLEKRVDVVESKSIASINGQITSINASITELKNADKSVLAQIEQLQQVAGGHQLLIDELKEADKNLAQKDKDLEARIAALESQQKTINGQISDLVKADEAINKRIDELKSYVENELKKYATTDWANATFATLEQYQKTADDLAVLSVTVKGISTSMTQMQSDISSLNAKIDGIDAAFQQKIDDLAASIASLKSEFEGKISDAVSQSEANLKAWIATQLEGYYTAAQADAKLAAMKSDLEASIAAGGSKNADAIAETKAGIAKLEADLNQAKKDLTDEYQKAISDAINGNDGYINDKIKQEFDNANSRIDVLETRVTALETEVGNLKSRMNAAEGKISTIEEQISGILAGISDLETMRSNIAKAMADIEAQGGDISALKAADKALEQRINELKAYIDGELSKYATTDWANATFATLKQYQQTEESLAALKTIMDKYEEFFKDGIAEAIQAQISAAKSTIEGWISADLLKDYWTAAETQAKLDEMKTELDNVKAESQSDIAAAKSEMEAKIKQLEDELAKAKDELKADYQAKIDAVIADVEAKTAELDAKIADALSQISDLSERISALESDVEKLKTDVTALKAMIQSASIVPAYDDGSVKAIVDSLQFKCIVSPAKSLNGITTLKDSLKVYACYAEAKTRTSDFTVIDVSEAEITDSGHGIISLKADISDVLPEGNSQVLTVALNIRNGISNFTTDFVKVTIVTLPPIFSVSATKKVHFSPGNLQYVKSTGTWRFAEHQYDIVETQTSDIGDNYAKQDIIGLFGWGTSGVAHGAACYQPWSTSRNDSAYYAYGDISKNLYDNDGMADWGVANDAALGGKGWRTLTPSEWNYVLNTRARTGYTTANTARYAKANVAGIKGLIIIPDGYKKTSGNTAAIGTLRLNYVNVSTGEGWGTNGNIITNTMWEDYDNAGCVFLPSAGARNGTGMTYNITNDGFYWSPTESGNNALNLSFADGNVRTSNGTGRHFGLAVRLVYDH